VKKLMSLQAKTFQVLEEALERFFVCVDNFGGEVGYDNSLHF
jgi:hypothetical protein